MFFTIISRLKNPRPIFILPIDKFDPVLKEIRLVTPFSLCIKVLVPLNFLNRICLFFFSLPFFIFIPIFLCKSGISFFINKSFDWWNRIIIS